MLSVFFQLIWQDQINLSLRVRYARVHKNQSQCARLVEKQLETFIFVLSYLNNICSFHFYCNSIKSFLQLGFCSVTVVWMSKIKCVSKNNSHTSDTSVRSYVLRRTHIQKNMSKALNLININSATAVLIII